MSLPNSDSLLDDLFRDALQPAAQATPPEDAWPRVTRALPVVPAALQLPSDAEILFRESWWSWISRSVLTIAPFWRVPVWRRSRWHRVVSWVHGYETVYPPSTSSLVCLEPDGRCQPSSFASVMAKQVLDLRLAS
jgi:hypothetical protein